LTESTAFLRWEEGIPRRGSSPLIGYSIELFSPDLQTGWVQAAHRVSETHITVSTFPLKMLLFIAFEFTAYYASVKRITVSLVSRIVPTDKVSRLSKTTQRAMRQNTVALENKMVKKYLVSW